MRASWSVLTAFALIGCTMSHPMEPEDTGPVVELPAAGRTAGMLVGPEGGTLTLGDLALDVPAGAVRSETEIRVTVEAAAAPAPFTGFSPVFRFEPAALVFERPVTVQLPFHGDAATATVFWTTLDSAAYAPLSTRIEGGLAIVETRHFSSAFVGTACSAEDCCGQANGDLDVLLMVDNSNSMAEEQASLAAQIPRLARVLATGDLDDDGVQDFPALQTLRMGTVSSDLGGGGYGVVSCESEFGDDGILLDPQPSCMASYTAPFAELDSSDPNADVDAFVDHVSCVANIGTNGCGFEQQLEAVLKALTPSTSPLRFYGDTTGHGDGANASFVRSSSLIATILLTDEEDCSVSDPSILDPNDSRYGANLNLRCFENPEALHPVSRFANGLMSLRANPDDVIFAAIAGVPVDLVSDPSAIDYTDILNDPRMIETIDPGTAGLTPSCDVIGRGLAFPPRRIVRVAESFGSNGIVQSICQEDFTPVVDAILQRVAARVSGACGG